MPSLQKVFRNERAAYMIIFHLCTSSIFRYIECCYRVVVDNDILFKNGVKSISFYKK